MLERASVIIKDSNKLSFDYVPVKLVCREEQMQRLLMLFRPVIEDGRSETAFLTGSIGTGKTATAKRFCADMMQYGMKNNVPLDFVLINCRQRSTETGVLLQLIRHYDPGFPDRGFASSEMMRALRGKIDKEKKRLVIVLDEVDILLKKGSIDLIYQLSRFSEENINVAASVSLILISQEYVLDRLDDASLSTFKRTNAIRFNKYTRDELREIIATRVEEALVTGGMQEDAIDLIADISSEYGDARFAIDLLDKSARIGEEKSEGIVTAEEIRAAKAMIYSVVTESKLSNLDKNHMITLLAIARSIKAMSYVQSPAAEKTYAVVCEEYGVTARKHTQFWSYVQDLEKINLIVTKTISDGNTGGRTTLISLPDIPSKILAKKIEEIME